MDKKFRTIIRLGAIAIIWSLWMCRNDNLFIDKDFFSFVGAIPVHKYSPFVFNITRSGAARPFSFYGGMYMAEIISEV